MWQRIRRWFRREERAPKWRRRKKRDPYAPLHVSVRKRREKPEPETDIYRDWLLGRDYHKKNGEEGDGDD